MSKNKSLQMQKPRGGNTDRLATMPAKRHLNDVVSIMESLPPFKNLIDRQLWSGLSDELRYTIAGFYFTGGAVTNERLHEHTDNFSKELSEVIFALRAKFLMIQGLLMGDPGIKQLQNALTHAAAEITASYDDVIAYWENVVRFGIGGDLGDFQTNRPDIHGSVIEHLNALKALYEGDDKPIKTVRRLDENSEGLIQAINTSNNASAVLQWLGEQARALHPEFSYIKAFNHIHYSLRKSDTKTALESEALAVMDRVINNAESRGADVDENKKSSVRNWITRLDKK